MISIGGENLPKTISAGLGANLAKLYKEKGLSKIELGLKKSYTVLDAKAQINRISDSQLEIKIKHRKKFCPIGGKYDPNKADLIQKSVCIPYTVGFLNEMDSQFKYQWDIHECVLETNNHYCRYTLYLEKKE
jgi:hypothetical protein